MDRSFNITKLDSEILLDEILKKELDYILLSKGKILNCPAGSEKDW